MERRAIQTLSDQQIISKYKSLEYQLKCAEENNQLVEAEEIQIEMTMLDRELVRRYK